MSLMMQAAALALEAQQAKYRALSTAQAAEDTQLMEYARVQDGMSAELLSVVRFGWVWEGVSEIFVCKAELKLSCLCR